MEAREFNCSATMSRKLNAVRTYSVLSTIVRATLLSIVIFATWRLHSRTPPLLLYSTTPVQQLHFLHQGPQKRLYIRHQPQRLEAAAVAEFDCRRRVDVDTHD